MAQGQEKVNEDGLTYKQWIRELDIYLIGKCGLTSSDLADTDTYSAWSDGMPASEHGSDMLFNELGEDFFGEDDE